MPAGRHEGWAVPLSGRRSARGPGPATNWLIQDLLIDLVPAMTHRGTKLDDDHVLAVFRRHGAWGAIAKSNYPWLRYREPVYRTLRELVMSYFEVYFSVNGIKALRGYTRPLDISSYRSLGLRLGRNGRGAALQELYTAARRSADLEACRGSAAAGRSPCV